MGCIVGGGIVVQFIGGSAVRFPLMSPEDDHVSDVRHGNRKCGLLYAKYIGL